jgi:branched-chain amino acid transport system substrate-binding protein
MRPTVVRILVQLSFAVIAPFSAGAQISDNVVKIGVLTDLSGTPTGMGSVVAAQMAADDFGGSVAGKPIVIVSADHQIKPDVGSAIARRWYDIEEVDVIVDVPASAVGLAVQNVAKEKKKMLIVHSTGTADFHGKFCSPYTMQWVFDTRALAVRDCARSRQARRRHLVFPHCRLRLWTFARAAGV